MGHGVRKRMMLGPPELGSEPEVGVVTTRRYRCTACGAVITVLPRGLLPRLRYGLGAIVLAIGLWWLGHRATEVRRRVSPFKVVGDEARRGWHSLRRWAHQLAQWVGLRTNRRVYPHLGTVLQRLASAALLSSGDLVRDAVAAAAFLDVPRLCADHPETPTM